MRKSVSSSRLHSVNTAKDVHQDIISAEKKYNSAPFRLTNPNMLSNFLIINGKADKSTAPVNENLYDNTLSLDYTYDSKNQKFMENRSAYLNENNFLHFSKFSNITCDTEYNISRSEYLKTQELNKNTYFLNSNSHINNIINLSPNLFKTINKRYISSSSSKSKESETNKYDINHSGKITYIGSSSSSSVYSGFLKRNNSYKIDNEIYSNRSNSQLRVFSHSLIQNSNLRNEFLINSSKRNSKSLDKYNIKYNHSRFKKKNKINSFNYNSKRYKFDPFTPEVKHIKKQSVININSKTLENIYSSRSHSSMLTESNFNKFIYQRHCSLPTTNLDIKLHSPLIPDLCLEQCNKDNHGYIQSSRKSDISFSPICNSKQYTKTKKITKSQLNLLDLDKVSQLSYHKNSKCSDSEKFVNDRNNHSTNNYANILDIFASCANFIDSYPIHEKDQSIKKSSKKIDSVHHIKGHHKSKENKKNLINYNQLNNGDSLIFCSDHIETNNTHILKNTIDMQLSVNRLINTSQNQSFIVSNESHIKSPCNNEKQTIKNNPLYSHFNIDTSTKIKHYTNISDSGRSEINPNRQVLRNNNLTRNTAQKTPELIDIKIIKTCADDSIPGLVSHMSEEKSQRESNSKLHRYKKPEDLELKDSTKKPSILSFIKENSMNSFRSKNSDIKRPFYTSINTQARLYTEPKKAFFPRERVGLSNYTKTKITKSPNIHSNERTSKVFTYSTAYNGVNAKNKYTVYKCKNQKIDSNVKSLYKKTDSQMSDVISKEDTKLLTSSNISSKESKNIDNCKSSQSNVDNESISEKKNVLVELIDYSFRDKKQISTQEIINHHVFDSQDKNLNNLFLTRQSSSIEQNEFDSHDDEYLLSSDTKINDTNMLSPINTIKKNTSDKLNIIFKSEESQNKILQRENENLSETYISDRSKEKFQNHEKFTNSLSSNEADKIYQQNISNNQNQPDELMWTPDDLFLRQLDDNIFEKTPSELKNSTDSSIKDKSPITTQQYFYKSKSPYSDENNEIYSESSLVNDFYENSKAKLSISEYRFEGYNDDSISTDTCQNSQSELKNNQEISNEDEIQLNNDIELCFQKPIYRHKTYSTDNPFVSFSQALLTYMPQGHLEPNIKKPDLSQYFKLSKKSNSKQKSGPIDTERYIGGEDFSNKKDSPKDTKIEENFIKETNSSYNSDKLKTVKYQLKHENHFHDLRSPEMVEKSQTDYIKSNNQEYISPNSIDILSYTMKNNVHSLDSKISQDTKISTGSEEYLKSFNTPSNISNILSDNEIVNGELCLLNNYDIEDDSNAKNTICIKEKKINKKLLLDSSSELTISRTISPTNFHYTELYKSYIPPSSYPLDNTVNYKTSQVSPDNKLNSNTSNWLNDNISWRFTVLEKNNKKKTHDDENFPSEIELIEGNNDVKTTVNHQDSQLIDIKKIKRSDRITLNESGYNSSSSISFSNMKLTKNSICDKQFKRYILPTSNLLIDSDSTTNNSNYRQLQRSNSDVSDDLSNDHIKSICADKLLNINLRSNSSSSYLSKSHSPDNLDDNQILFNHWSEKKSTNSISSNTSTNLSNSNDRTYEQYLVTHTPCIKNNQKKNTNNSINLSPVRSVNCSITKSLAKSSQRSISVLINPNKYSLFVEPYVNTIQPIQIEPITFNKTAERYILNKSEMKTKETPSYKIDQKSTVKRQLPATRSSLQKKDIIDINEIAERSSNSKTFPNFDTNNNELLLDTKIYEPKKIEKNITLEKSSSIASENILSVERQETDTDIDTNYSEKSKSTVMPLRNNISTEDKALNIKTQSVTNYILEEISTASNKAIDNLNRSKTNQIKIAIDSRNSSKSSLRSYSSDNDIDNTNTSLNFSESRRLELGSIGSVFNILQELETSLAQIKHSQTIFSLVYKLLTVIDEKWSQYSSVLNRQINECINHRAIEDCLGTILKEAKQNLTVLHESTLKKNNTLADISSKILRAINTACNISDQQPEKAILQPEEELSIPNLAGYFNSLLGRSKKNYTINENVLLNSLYDYETNDIGNFINTTYLKNNILNLTTEQKDSNIETTFNDILSISTNNSIQNKEEYINSKKLEISSENLNNLDIKNDNIILDFQNHDNYNKTNKSEKFSLVNNGNDNIDKKDISISPIQQFTDENWLLSQLFKDSRNQSNQNSLKSNNLLQPDNYSLTDLEVLLRNLEDTGVNITNKKVKKNRIIFGACIKLESLSTQVKTMKNLIPTGGVKAELDRLNKLIESNQKLSKDTEITLKKQLHLKEGRIAALEDALQSIAQGPLSTCIPSPSKIQKKPTETKNQHKLQTSNDNSGNEYSTCSISPKKQLSKNLKTNKKIDNNKNIDKNKKDNRSKKNTFVSVASQTKLSGPVVKIDEFNSISTISKHLITANTEADITRILTSISYKKKSEELMNIIKLFKTTVDDNEKLKEQNKSLLDELVKSNDNRFSAELELEKLVDCLKSNDQDINNLTTQSKKANNFNNPTNIKSDSNSPENCKFNKTSLHIQSKPYNNLTNSKISQQNITSKHNQITTSYSEYIDELLTTSETCPLVEQVDDNYTVTYGNKLLGEKKKQDKTTSRISFSLKQPSDDISQLVSSKAINSEFNGSKHIKLDEYFKSTVANKTIVSDVLKEQLETVKVHNTQNEKHLALSCMALNQTISECETKAHSIDDNIIELEDERVSIREKLLQVKYKRVELHKTLNNLENISNEISNKTNLSRNMTLDLSLEADELDSAINEVNNTIEKYSKSLRLTNLQKKASALLSKNVKKPILKSLKISPTPLSLEEQLRCARQDLDDMYIQANSAQARYTQLVNKFDSSIDARITEINDLTHQRDLLLRVSNLSKEDWLVSWTNHSEDSTLLLNKIQHSLQKCGPNNISYIPSMTKMDFKTQQNVMVGNICNIEMNSTRQVDQGEDNTRRYSAQEALNLLTTQNHSDYRDSIESPSNIATHTSRKPSLLSQYGSSYRSNDYNSFILDDINQLNVSDNQSSKPRSITQSNDLSRCLKRALSYPGSISFNHSLENSESENSKYITTNPEENRASSCLGTNGEYEKRYILGKAHISRKGRPRGSYITGSGSIKYSYIDKNRRPISQRYKNHIRFNSQKLNRKKSVSKKSRIKNKKHQSSVNEELKNSWIKLLKEIIKKKRSSSKQKVFDFIANEMTAQSRNNFLTNDNNSFSELSEYDKLLLICAKREYSNLYLQRNSLTDIPPFGQQTKSSTIPERFETEIASLFAQAQALLKHGQDSSSFWYIHASSVLNQAQHIYGTLQSTEGVIKFVINSMSHFLYKQDSIHLQYPTKKHFFETDNIVLKCNSNLSSKSNSSRLYFPPQKNQILSTPDIFSKYTEQTNYFSSEQSTRYKATEFYGYTYASALLPSSSSLELTPQRDDDVTISHSSINNLSNHLTSDSLIGIGNPRVYIPKLLNLAEATELTCSPAHSPYDGAALTRIIAQPLDTPQSGTLGQCPTDYEGFEDQPEFQAALMCMKLFINPVLNQNNFNKSMNSNMKTKANNQVEFECTNLSKCIDNIPPCTGNSQYLSSHINMITELKGEQNKATTVIDPTIGVSMITTILSLLDEPMPDILNMRPEDIESLLAISSRLCAMLFAVTHLQPYHQKSILLKHEKSWNIWAKQLAGSSQSNYIGKYFCLLPVKIPLSKDLQDIKVPLTEPVNRYSCALLRSCSLPCNVNESLKSELNSSQQSLKQLFDKKTQDHKVVLDDMKYLSRSYSSVPPLNFIEDIYPSILSLFLNIISESSNFGLTDISSTLYNLNENCKKSWRLLQKAGFMESFNSDLNNRNNIHDVLKLISSILILQSDFMSNKLIRSLKEDSTNQDITETQNNLLNYSYILKQQYTNFLKGSYIDSIEELNTSSIININSSSIHGNIIERHDTPMKDLTSIFSPNRKTSKSSISKSYSSNISLNNSKSVIFTNSELVNENIYVNQELKNQNINSLKDSDERDNLFKQYSHNTLVDTNYNQKSVFNNSFTQNSINSNNNKQFHFTDSFFSSKSINNVPRPSSLLLSNIRLTDDINFSPLSYQMKEKSPINSSDSINSFTNINDNFTETKNSSIYKNEINDTNLLSNHSDINLNPNHQTNNLDLSGTHEALFCAARDIRTIGKQLSNILNKFSDTFKTDDNKLCSEDKKEAMSQVVFCGSTSIDGLPYHNTSIQSSSILSKNIFNDITLTSDLFSVEEKTPRSIALQELRSARQEAMYMCKLVEAAYKKLDSTNDTIQDKPEDFNTLAYPEKNSENKFEDFSRSICNNKSQICESQQNRLTNTSIEMLSTANDFTYMDYEHYNPKSYQKPYSSIYPNVTNNFGIHNILDNRNTDDSIYNQLNSKNSKESLKSKYISNISSKTSPKSSLISDLSEKDSPKSRFISNLTEKEFTLTDDKSCKVKNSDQKIYNENTNSMKYNKILDITKSPFHPIDRKSKFISVNENLRAIQNICRMDIVPLMNTNFNKTKNHDIISKNQVLEKSLDFNSSRNSKLLNSSHKRNEQYKNNLLSLQMDIYSPKGISETSSKNRKEFNDSFRIATSTGRTIYTVRDNTFKSDKNIRYEKSDMLNKLAFSSSEASDYSYSGQNKLFESFNNLDTVKHISVNPALRSKSATFCYKTYMKLNNNLKNHPSRFIGIEKTLSSDNINERNSFDTFKGLRYKLPSTRPKYSSSRSKINEGLQITKTLEDITQRAKSSSEIKTNNYNFTYSNEREKHNTHELQDDICKLKSDIEYKKILTEKLEDEKNNLGKELSKIQVKYSIALENATEARKALAESKKMANNTILEAKLAEEALKTITKSTVSIKHRLTKLAAQASESCVLQELARDELNNFTFSTSLLQDNISVITNQNTILQEKESNLKNTYETIIYTKTGNKLSRDIKTMNSSSESISMNKKFNQNSDLISRTDPFDPIKKKTLHNSLSVALAKVHVIAELELKRRHLWIKTICDDSKNQELPDSTNFIPHESCSIQTLINLINRKLDSLTNSACLTLKHETHKVKTVNTIMSHSKICETSLSSLKNVYSSTFNAILDYASNLGKDNSILSQAVQEMGNIVLGSSTTESANRVALRVEKKINSLNIWSTNNEYFDHVKNSILEALEKNKKEELLSKKQKEEYYLMIKLSIRRLCDDVILSMTIADKRCPKCIHSKKSLRSASEYCNKNYVDGNKSTELQLLNSNISDIYIDKNSTELKKLSNQQLISLVFYLKKHIAILKHNNSLSWSDIISDLYYQLESSYIYSTNLQNKVETPETTNIIKSETLNDNLNCSSINSKNDKIPKSYHMGIILKPEISLNDSTISSLNKDIQNQLEISQHWKKTAEYLWLLLQSSKSTISDINTKNLKSNICNQLHLENEIITARAIAKRAIAAELYVLELYHELSYTKKLKVSDDSDNSWKNLSIKLVSVIQKDMVPRILLAQWKNISSQYEKKAQEVNRLEIQLQTWQTIAGILTDSLKNKFIFNDLPKLNPDLFNIYPQIGFEKELKLIPDIPQENLSGNGDWYTFLSTTLSANQLKKLDRIWMKAEKKQPVDDSNITHISDFNMTCHSQIVRKRPGGVEVDIGASLDITSRNQTSDLDSDLDDWLKFAKDLSSKYSTSNKPKHDNMENSLNFSPSQNDNSKASLNSTLEKLYELSGSVLKQYKSAATALAVSPAISDDLSQDSQTVISDMYDTRELRKSLKRLCNDKTLSSTNI